MAKKRFWHLMLLSYFIPIIGGLIVYAMKKDEDSELANICFIGSFFNPWLIGFIVGFILTFITDIFLIDYVVIYGIGLIFCWMAIKSIYPDNKYRYFLPVFWFGLFGALYSYYDAYKNEETLKHNVGWFFFFQLLLTIFGLPFISVLLLTQF